MSANTSSVSADRLGTSPLRTPPSQRSGEALKHERINQLQNFVNDFSFAGLSSHPDFGDGLLQAFVVDLPQGDGVELAFVQVRHGPVARLLSQGLGRLEGVLEIIPANTQDSGRSENPGHSARFSFDSGLEISASVRTLVFHAEQGNPVSPLWLGVYGAARWCYSPGHGVELRVVVRRD